MTVRKAAWVQAETGLDAETDRLTRGLFLTPGSGVTSRSGVRPGGSLAVSPNGTPNMTVLVAAGLAAIQGTLSTAQGSYLWANDAQVSLTIGTANGSNPRNDLIVAKVVDPQYAGTLGYTLAVVPGTAAASPADPAVPDNAITLARVRVGAGVTSISSGNITDLRPIVVSSGGVTPCASTAPPSPAYEGMLAYFIDTDTVNAYDGGAWRPQARQPTVTTYTSDNAADVGRAIGASGAAAHYTTISTSRPALVICKARLYSRWLSGTCFCALAVESPTGTTLRQVQNEGILGTGSVVEPIDLFYMWAAPTPGAIDVTITESCGSASSVSVLFSRFTSNIITIEF